MEQKYPLLLLHGFPLNPSMWQDQINYFSKERECLAPNLLLESSGGSGDGNREDNPVCQLPRAVTMEQMAEAAVQALDREGIERCVAIGFSMGGYVLFALHERYPERIAGIVLADTRSEADTAEGRKGRGELAKAVLKRGAVAAAEGMLNKLLAPASLAERPELVERVKAMMLQGKPEAIAAASVGMATRPDMTERLPSIRVPVLVIAGEQDAITPPEGARKMAERAADGEFVPIPDGGHLANMEQPDEFNNALSSWLSRKHL